MVMRVVLDVGVELCGQPAGWEGKLIHPQASIQCVPSSYSLGTPTCCVTIKQSSLK